MSEKSNATGGCLCRAVSFELRFPSKWCAHCHCGMCRRAHGAGFVTWAGFDEGHFEVTAGNDQLAWYRSSTAAQRGFCRRCGSSMLFQSSRWPGEMHVALGSIHGPIDRKPEANVCMDNHVDWMPVDQDLLSVKL
ncbi:MAG: GFA family protein [Xanthomonadales bacterium]|nr:GFA family protein [Gammaproteobacteria bacterium]MBT8051182.1 GFA family protein [Gammaproteobacteria bacterium]MBT8057769.1 GFA family protein [Gammaproteobacteria bacterium]NNL04226.1 GFA family protein [Xanthomonadales bacterium]